MEDITETVEPSNCNFARRKKWKPSAGWPAASRMTSTIC